MYLGASLNLAKINKYCYNDLTRLKNLIFILETPRVIVIVISYQ
jgi:hypothetical protein